MKQLMLKPTIYKYDTCKEFADEFHIEKGDLVITNEYIYEPFFGKMDLECDVIFQEKYGAGEPSDDMAEAIYKDIKGEHKRIIAIGGGTVIDISKLFALKYVSPILDLYDGKLPIEKDKELCIFLDKFIPLAKASPFVLSDKSHVSGGPWDVTPAFKEIDEKIIQVYFSAKYGNE